MMMSLLRPSSLPAQLPMMMMRMMMMLSLTFVVCHGQQQQQQEKFIPYRMSYDTLLQSIGTTQDDRMHHYNDNDDTTDMCDFDFWQALTTVGMISITDLPFATQQAFATMIQTQDACIQSMQNNDKQTRTLLDGTIRQTIATQTIRPSSSSSSTTTTTDDTTTVQDSSVVSSCQLFNDAATIFRTTTNSAVAAFAQRVSQYMMLNAMPVLLHLKQEEDDYTDATSSSSSPSIHTFHDIVQQGIQLEHFHSYSTPTKNSGNNATSSSTAATTNGKKATTIELHTDQGLFLAFTPGRLAVSGEMTDGFTISIPSDNDNDGDSTGGRMVEVSFTEQDELVFLLGDGVNQYINHQMLDRTKQQRNLSSLRAVPHALQWDDSSSSSNRNHHRIWYGVMILPPPNAIHPIYNQTFAELRAGLMNDPDTYMQMACSNSALSVSSNHHGGGVTDHRRLEGDDNDDHHGSNGTQCDHDDEIYCWHRCMNVTEYDVSHEQCDENFRLLTCINPRDEVWSGMQHGDYFPGCAESDAVNETAFTTLPNYPRDDTACTAFDTAFATTTDGAIVYDHSMDLDGGNGAKFQYTVLSDGAVMGRLIFNGIFGYVSVGLAGVGGRNPMHNGRVIVATRGSDYTPRSGLDVSLANSVDEYIIDAEATTFRIWGMTPYSTDSSSVQRNSNRHRQLKEYSVVADDCYTMLSFTTDAIADQTFNVQGSDTLMWAANNIDTYMQYHGANRGIFTVDWTIAPPTTTTTTSVGIMVAVCSTSLVMTAMVVSIVLLL